MAGTTAAAASVYLHGANAARSLRDSLGDVARLSDGLSEIRWWITHRILLRSIAKALTMKIIHISSAFALLIGSLATATACNFPSDGVLDQPFMIDVPNVDRPNPMDIPSVTIDVPDLDVTESSITCSGEASVSSQVCNNECVDTATSARHCGMCSNPCAPGAMCVEGACVASCTGGTVRCGGRCIDPRTNTEYCGADSMCMGSTACTRGQVCIAGRCSVFCPAGQVNCGNNCIDPTSNPAFCGASGECTGMTAGSTCGVGQVCSASRCGATCPVGFVNCMGNCVDPQSNPRFCGANFACAAGSFTQCSMTEICSGGRCSSSCGAGTVRCGNPPTCVDPAANLRYCGARLDCVGANAGTQCALGELCLNGSCVYAPPPDTVLSTAAGGQDIRVRHSLNSLRLSATQSVTFYYTLDGSLPMAGAMGTVAAVGQTVILPQLAGLDNPLNQEWCRTVRWFADYGAPLGREIRIHTVNVCNVLPAVEAENNYETMDQFSLSVGGVDQGALAVVSPGAVVQMLFRYRTGVSINQPLVAMARIARVFVQGVNTPGNFCHFYGNAVQGAPAGPTSVVHSQPITAPLAPGRYAIRLSVQQDQAPIHCAAPISLPGIRTVGYIVVR